MSKILTITLNPAVDKNSSTKRVIQDSKLRCDKPSFQPGGGGINVSRVISHLGMDSLAIFPSGGPTGVAIESLLNDQQVPFQAIPINGWTRENLNVFEEDSGKQYRFIMPGPALSKDDCENIKKAVELVQDYSVVVISGSIPDETNEHIYAELSEIVQENGAKCIIDTSGTPLKNALEHGKIFLSKPNNHELSKLSGRDIESTIELEEVAKSIINKGHVESLVVSLGPQGALLVTKDQTEQIIPPVVKRLSTVGAGDSMVAGIAISLAKNETLNQAIRLGVACGTAATMNHGSELCKKSDVEKIHNWILDKYPL